jgi:predicted transcriptional regulator
MKKLNNQINETPALSKDEEAILLKKIEIALEQLKNGEFLTEDELDKEIDSWG